MAKYREILHLKSLGFSERNIAHSCGFPRFIIFSYRQYFLHTILSTTLV